MAPVEDSIGAFVLELLVRATDTDDVPVVMAFVECLCRAPVDCSVAHSDSALFRECLLLLGVEVVEALVSKIAQVCTKSPRVRGCFPHVQRDLAQAADIQAGLRALAVFAKQSKFTGAPATRHAIAS